MLLCGLESMFYFMAILLTDHFAVMRIDRMTRASSPSAEAPCDLVIPPLGGHPDCAAGSRPKPGQT